MAKLFPYLLRKIDGERRHQQGEYFQNLRHRGRVDILLFDVEHVDQFHDRGNAGVEVPAGFEIVRHLPDGLVELAEHLAIGLAGAPLLGDVARGETVGAAQETGDAFGALGAPVDFSFGRTGEEYEHAGGIGAELLGQHVGAHHVALGLRHLGAFGDHHALREESPGGLVVLDEADIAHHLGEKSRVDQVQDGVFDPADILVDFEPVGDLGRVERRDAVVRVAVPVEIPGAVEKRIHGIGFAFGGAAALGAGYVDEGRNVFERRAAGAGDIDAVGQDDGELVFGNRHHAVPRTMDHGNRGAPVTLARDAPVLDAKDDGGLAEAVLFGVRAHLAARLGAGEAGPGAGVFHDAVLAEGFLHAGLDG